MTRKVTRSTTPGSAENEENVEEVRKAQATLTEYEADRAGFAWNKCVRVLLKKAVDVLMMTLGQVANVDPVEAARIIARFVSDDMIKGTEEDAKEGLFNLAKAAHAGTLGLINSRAEVPKALKNLKQHSPAVGNAKKTGTAYSGLITVLSSPKNNLEHCRKIKAALDILLGVLNNDCVVATTPINNFDFVLNGMSILSSYLDHYGQGILFQDVVNYLSFIRNVVPSDDNVSILLYYCSSFVSDTAGHKSNHPPSLPQSINHRSTHYSHYFTGT